MANFKIMTTRNVFSKISAVRLLFRQRQVSSCVAFGLNPMQIVRRYAAAPSSSKADKLKGIIIGVFTDNCEYKFTKSGTKFNSESGGKIESVLNLNLDSLPNLGNVLLLQNIDEEYYTVAVVGLGKEEVGLNTLEILDECRENIRIAVGIGARRLYEMGITEITVESFGQSEAAAEGAALAVWKYDEHKDKEDRKEPAQFQLLYEEDKDSWERGLFKAELQNFVRHICETPANYMTPSVFARLAENFLCACPGINVDIKNEEFMTKNGLHAILHVARSSEHKPLMLEVKYCGGKAGDRVFMFIGKGVTYDTGSLFLRKCKEMAEHKGDLAGGAIVVAVMRALAVFQLPINVVGLVPVCENATGGKSLRPGDVVFTCKNKTIQIANPDHEGRIIMADAMQYGATLEPRLLVTITTMTKGVRSALGDRVWRLPLWNFYHEKLTRLTNADISNKGDVPSLGACFLKEFVPPCCEWIHFDITGVGLKCDGPEDTYYTVGLMTGRPTRTIVQFLYQLSCPPECCIPLEDPCPKPEPCPPKDEKSN
ncbi:Cytosol aminopeptidase [Blattella germanica]|nr:Cytosol aminopeptidase [Blattella germanica]